MLKFGTTDPLKITGAIRGMNSASLRRLADECNADATKLEIEAGASASSLAQQPKLQTARQGHTQSLADTIDPIQEEASHMHDYDLQDSGVRQQFETGAVRDTQSGKGRFDLLPPAAMLRIAKHFEKGA